MPFAEAETYRFNPFDLLFRPGTTTKRLAVTEAKEEDLVGGTKAHARRVLIVYAVLTGTVGNWTLKIRFCRPELSAGTWPTWWKAWISSSSPR